MISKIAAVTGSRRGIGLEIAKSLLSGGYRVILSATANPQEAAPLIAELGTGCEYIQCDISAPAMREDFFRSVTEKYGRLDVFVNNAGVAPKTRNDILQTDIESFEQLIKVNLEGTFFMCQLAANTMLQMQGNALEEYCPRIVNISSISAYTSSTNRGEYCISKAGISMVTRLFADRLARHGIPVFEVRPGIIRTDMTEAVTQKYENLIAGGLTPINRMGTPKDVANCVMAAVSGLLDFATGQVLNPDGGFHIRRL